MTYNFSEYHMFQALCRFENQHLPLDLFLRHYFKAHPALGAKDRRLVSDAIYGMMRWQLLLDHLIGQGATWKQRYRIYQQFQPTHYLSVNAIPLHIRLSFPEELFSLLVKAYGEERAIYLAQVLNTQATTTVRINPLKTTREEMLQKWRDTYPVRPCKEAPYGIIFEKRAPLFALPEYKEGFFEMQDEASQLICEKMEVGEHDDVLDYCAGSGGKTLGIAHKTKGTLYLHDNRPLILQKAKKRLQRAGVKNACLFTPLSLQLKEKLDLVIVDVPCSSSGTLRRNPELKRTFSLALLEQKRREQREIFAKALPYLKKGGQMVYITCSILKEENEEQVAYFLRHALVEMHKTPFCSHPSMGGMDGLFAATFIKK